MTIDIEKLASESGGTKQFGGWYLNKESLTQFAAKVLEEQDELVKQQEREIGELHKKIEYFDRSSKSGWEKANELQAHINDLREALEKTATKVITDGNPSTTYLYEDIHEALSKTPAQSLIEHDNNLIEWCVKAI